MLNIEHGLIESEHALIYTKHKVQRSGVSIAQSEEVMISNAEIAGVKNRYSTENDWYE